MPTILDVAAKAGVGVGTVSRVLNDSVHVSDATRAKVLAAIAELGYRPSSVARALSSGRSSALPVFAIDITLPSLTARLRGILDIVDEVHELVICQVREPQQRTEFVDRHAMRLPAFGVLSISLDLAKNEIEAFRNAGVAVVSIDHRIDGVPSIVIDDTAAGELAAQHMIDRGHERISFIADEPKGDYRTRASEERRAGFGAALDAAGLERGPEAFVTTSKRKAARELLGRSDRPTAIVADADSTALCVLAVARELELSVPGDLSVIGFDDLWAADAAGLTTVAQPLEHSGRLGAQTLFALTRGEEVPLLTELEVEIIERDTTGPPA